VKTIYRHHTKILLENIGLAHYILCLEVAIHTCKFRWSVKLKKYNNSQFTNVQIVIKRQGCFGHFAWNTVTSFCEQLHSKCPHIHWTSV